VLYVIPCILTLVHVYMDFRYVEPFDIVVSLIPVVNIGFGMLAVSEYYRRKKLR
jgi:hypothetical protein